MTTATSTIRIVDVTQTCAGCPSQWDGKTDDGRYVYIRYRYGEGRIDVAESQAAWFDDQSECVATWGEGGSFDGFCSIEDVIAGTADQVEFALP